MTHLIQQQIEQIQRERDAEIRVEAQRRADEIQRQQEAAAQQREAQFQQAVTDHAAMVAECNRLNAEMLAAFNGPEVSYTALRDAHGAALAAFNRHLAHTRQAVGLYVQGYQTPDNLTASHVTDYERGTDYTNTVALRYHQFRNPVSPANTLIRWVADAPDADARRWRQGLVYVFYDQLYDPRADFDPQAATDHDVYNARFRRGM